MILVGWEHFQPCPHVLQHICHDPMILDAHNCHQPTFCMPTYQPQLPVLAASTVESLACLGQSYVQLSDCAKSNQRLAQAVVRCRICIRVQAVNVCVAEFTSACRLPMFVLPNPATSPVLVSLSPWRVFLLGLDNPSSSPCSSTIFVADFSLTNLQLHKSALLIYPTVGMAASTLRHCFGQHAEVCTSCTFDTVTVHHNTTITARDWII